MVNIQQEFVYFDLPVKIYNANNKNIHDLSRGIYHKVDDMLCGRSMEVSDAYNSVFTIGQLIKWNQHEKHI